MEAIRFSPITEADGVVWIVDGSQYILLLSEGIVGDDAGLELGVLAGATADADYDRCVLTLERAVKDLLHAALSILKWRLDEDGAPDPELLDDVAGLEHIVGPFAAFGAALETVDGKDVEVFGGVGG